ncbi:MAG: Rrf2 family transcriptional regulator [Spirochaetota bacterium]|nr:Rrf2 family transcriptional regulator [Spirochaetota bacterium]
MLTISAKGTYGLAAVFELAKQYNQGPLHIKFIAETQGIPQNYLEQLLVKLKKAQIVKSYRGAQGGYELADSPANITVNDILNCLEGQLELVHNSGKIKSIAQLWQTAHQVINDVFNITLEELVLQEKRLDKQIVYSI